MRPLNLIPPEERRGESAPLRAGALSYAIVGFLAVALIAVVALVLTSNKINDNKSQLATLEARSAAAQEASNALTPYDDFAALTASRSQTVTSLAQSRFDWHRVLQELALVIPSNVTLENLSGAATADSAATAAASSTGSTGAVTGPSLQLSGCADGQEGVAQLLAALRDIDGVTRVGMQSSTLSDQDAAAGSASSSTGGGCSSDPTAANFEITVGFDAVPRAGATGATGATGVPATGTTTTPAPTTTTPAAGTPTSATTTDDGGAAQTQNEQQGAADSANNQTRKAHDTAAAVGVGQ
jgi:Tfp pilus assembly protein PilN